MNLESFYVVNGRKYRELPAEERNSNALASIALKERALSFLAEKARGAL